MLWQEIVQHLPRLESAHNTALGCRWKLPHVLANSFVYSPEAQTLRSPKQNIYTYTWLCIVATRSNTKTSRVHALIRKRVFENLMNWNRYSKGKSSPAEMYIEDSFTLKHINGWKRRTVNVNILLVSTGETSAELWTRDRKWLSVTVEYSTDKTDTWSQRQEYFKSLLFANSHSAIAH